MQKGFTLIELMIASAITMLLIAIVGAFYQFYIRSYTISFDQAEVIDKASLYLQTLATEVRQMRRSDEGSYPLQGADDNEIVFFADIDGDGQSEKVRYWHQDNAVYKGVVEPNYEAYPMYDDTLEKTRMLFDHLVHSSNLFTYYNDSWPEDVINNPVLLMDRLQDARLIKVFIEVEADGVNSPQKAALERYINLRTLKTN